MGEVMKLVLLLLIACTFLAAAGCYVGPSGRDRGDYRYQNDYGHRVWRE